MQRMIEVFMMLIVPHWFNGSWKSAESGLRKWSRRLVAPSLTTGPERTVEPRLGVFLFVLYQGAPPQGGSL